MTSYTDAASVTAQVGKTGSEWDTILTDKVIPAISATIDRYCNRPDGFVAPDDATARVYAGTGGRVLRIDEAAVVTSVAVKTATTDATYTAWDGDDWIAFAGAADNPDFNSTPYTGLMVAPSASSIFTSGYDSDDLSWASTRRRGLSGLSGRRVSPPMVQVTARWGYATTVPPQIEEACIIECARLVKQASSNFADTLINETLGQLAMTAQLHPTTKLMLEKGRFVRPTVG